MTTGSWSTGPFTKTTKLHAAKSWFGGDGKTVTDRISTTPKWNAYTMAHAKFHSGNPNVLSFLDLIDHQEKEVDNHSWDAGGGSDATASGYGQFYGDGTLNPTFPEYQFNQIWDFTQESRLLSKMLKKVKGHELHLGVALAEVDKLAGTVLGTIKTLVYGINDLRNLRFAAFARRFGTSPPRKDRVNKLKLLDISGRFLEMRYAWEPTIQDAFEAATAFEALSNGPRKALIRATRRMGTEPVYFTNYCKVNQTTILQRTYLFEMYEEMGAFRQMGLIDPLSIIWERIPFSFVFDWFIPIGTYLNLIGQVPFMNGRWLLTESIKWSSSGSYLMEPNPYIVPHGRPVDCDWERFNLRRRLLGSPPSVPFPRFKVAGAVQGKRLQNAIALAHQLIGGNGTHIAYHY